MIRPRQVLVLIIAGAALAAGGLWLVSRTGSDSTPDTLGQVLPLPQSALNTVTRLRIFKGDGSHTTLERGATQWSVAERGYSADSGQVRKLLLDLSALQAEEQKTSDPALYAKLGVEDPSNAQATGTGVDVELNGKALGLIIGRTDGTRAVFVRLAGHSNAMLATPQLTPDADPRHWIDHALLDIGPEQIAEVDVKPEGAPEYVIKRAAAGGSEAAPVFAVTPMPKGRELADATTVGAQAGALAALQLDDVRRPGSLAAAAHANFLTRDGLILVMAGIQDAERRYITFVVSAPASTAPAAVKARAHDLNMRLSGWEFEIPGYRYESLFRPLEQLLKPMPVPHARGSKTVPAPTVPAHLPFGPASHPDAGADPVTPQQSH